MKNLCLLLLTGFVLSACSSTDCTNRSFESCHVYGSAEELYKNRSE